MFEIIMGLEVHIQLNTKTKLFCGCSTNFNSKPNTNVCPICLGLPGSLPKANKEAFVKAIKFGNAINATINNNSIFERKNYFYPDSPTGYQISQLQVPIVEFGEFFIEDKEGKEKRIRINRAHLETDAGKSIHQNTNSLVDLNRCGIPLLEIVTEPDFKSYEEVDYYLKELQTLVRHLDISDANMQEGSFRCDVNISIRPKGEDKLYTRVEIKNMNSFKFIQQAIKYETLRQIECWEDDVYDTEVRQETRLFDVNDGITKPMRGKEEANDYRYFPDPDLKEITLTEEILELGSYLPELPKDKLDRYINKLKISKKDAKRIISDITLSHIFDDFTNGGLDPKICITWLLVEYQGRINKEEYKSRTSDITMTDLATIIMMVQHNQISGKSGKLILDYIVEKRNNINEIVETIVDKLGLKQNNDIKELEKIVAQVITDNSKVIEEYKSGKKKVIGSLIGKIIKETKNSFNPKIINEILIKKIN